MPYINILNVTDINCNTIDTQETNRADTCSTNTTIYKGSRHEQHYSNMMWEADRAENCYANTDNMSKFNNKDKPIAIDNESTK